MKRSFSDFTDLSNHRDNIPMSMEERYLDLSVPCRGFTDIWVQDRGQEPYLHNSDHNLIVHTSRAVLARLIRDPDPSDKISYAMFGNCVAPLGNITSPPVPTLTDTGMTDTSPYTKSIASATEVTYLDSYAKGSLFTITLDYEDCNGDNPPNYVRILTEVGLYTTGGVLYARRTFPAILKNPNRRLTVLWTIVV